MQEGEYVYILPLDKAQLMIIFVKIFFKKNCAVGPNRQFVVYNCLLHVFFCRCELQI